jgi:hypothetical protein
VLAAFAEGREEPLPAYRLNCWGHSLAGRRDSTSWSRSPSCGT